MATTIDFKKDLKLRLQEDKMANIVTKDVRTYVKELIFYGEIMKAKS